MGERRGAPCLEWLNSIGVPGRLLLLAATLATFDEHRCRRQTIPGQHPAPPFAAVRRLGRRGIALVFPIEDDRTMNRKQRIARPVVEPMEARALLSTASIGTPIHLHGTLHVSASGVVNPAANTAYSMTVTQSGNISPLGFIHTAKTVRDPGGILLPGTLPDSGAQTFTTSRGSVTVNARPGPGHQVLYTITGGSGAFQGATGSGTFHAHLGHVGMHRVGHNTRVSATFQLIFS